MTASLRSSRASKEERAWSVALETAVSNALPDDWVSTTAGARQKGDLSGARSNVPGGRAPSAQPLGESGRVDGGSSRPH